MCLLTRAMTLTLERLETSAVAKELPRLCILDDDPAIVKMLQATVEQWGFSSCGTSDPRQALDEISGQCRVLLCDARMPSMDGLAFLEQALKRDPGCFVILISGYDSIESAIEAIRHGAYDYLPEPIDQSRLRKTLGELSDQLQRRRRISGLDEQLLHDLEFHGIVGRSAGMLELFDFARKVARHYSNVLITGASGTGKELVAHSLHEMSPVAGRRFAVCNCSAVAETLLESQLFGHVRGAFTGATDTRPGLFEYASGGTVFLDEVGETSLAVQAKLLRVIQKREIQRVGSPEVRSVDIRLIAATSRDLQAEVLAGRFREDLFYRLSTIQLRVPPLVERQDDIPLLVAYFLKKYGQLYQKQIRGLTHKAKAVLSRHTWPGNVRELENVIASASLMAAGDFIDVLDLPQHLQKPPQPATATDAWRPLPLEEVRKQHIQRILQLCGGNRVRAAQLLGIGRTSLYRHLKRESGGRVCIDSGDSVRVRPLVHAD
jgi:two-component system, NtrC family, response regulator HydG